MQRVKSIPGRQVRKGRQSASRRDLVSEMEGQKQKSQPANCFCLCRIWVRSCPYVPETRFPFFPQQRTSPTEFRDRFWNNRHGPSHRQAQSASAALRIFVRHLKKTFATISATSGLMHRSKLRLIRSPRRRGRQRPRHDEAEHVAALKSMIISAFVACCYLMMGHLRLAVPSLRSIRLRT